MTSLCCTGIVSHLLWIKFVARLIPRPIRAEEKGSGFPLCDYACNHP